MFLTVRDRLRFFSASRFAFILAACCLVMMVLVVLGLFREFRILNLAIAIFLPTAAYTSLKIRRLIQLQ